MSKKILADTKSWAIALAVAVIITVVGWTLFAKGACGCGDGCPAACPCGCQE